MEENYIVISGNEIVDLETPMFDGKYAKEEEYKKLLEEMQPLFNEFDCTGSVSEPKYEDMEKIVSKRNEQRLYDNFFRTFINLANRIEVEKTADDLYKPVYDGYHRLYVAKKYGLKILVYLV